VGQPDPACLRGPRSVSPAERERDSMIGIIWQIRRTVMWSCILDLGIDRDAIMALTVPSAVQVRKPHEDGFEDSRQTDAGGFLFVFVLFSSPSPTLRPAQPPPCPSRGGASRPFGPQTPVRLGWEWDSP